MIVTKHEPKSHDNEHKRPTGTSLRVRLKRTLQSLKNARLLRFARNDKIYRWICNENNSLSHPPDITQHLPPLKVWWGRKCLNRGGFTLLEVLVAIAVLGIAIAIVLQLFSANLRALAASEDYVSAAKRAEAKMREIADDPALSEMSLSETTGDGYRIDVSVTNVLEERTENLPVKMLEISMTVSWRTGVKERSLNLKTMKVVRKEFT